MTQHDNPFGRRRYLKYTGSAVMGSAGLAGCLNANMGSTGSNNKSLTMSSFKEGTGWYVMAGAIADHVQSNLPKGSQVSVRPFGGSIGTIKLLRKGKADVGLNHPVTAGWAMKSKYVFEGEKPYKNLRAIVGHLDTYWVLVAIRDELGISSFKDLKEQQKGIRLGTGPSGGVANTGVKQAFEDHGITFDDIKNWGGGIEQMGLGDMPTAMRNKDIDAMGWVATPGHPTWTQVSKDVNITFLPFTDKGRKNMRSKGWMDMPPMPKGEFGASQKIPSVGWRTMVLTNTEMTNETARVFAKTIIKQKDNISNAYSAMKIFDPEKAGKKKFTVVPLHNGSKSYLKENGYL